MSVINEALIEERKRLLMTSTRNTVLVANPTCVDSTEAGLYKIHDPDPGDNPNTSATQAGNAKGGLAGELSWKSFSYDAAGTAYGL
jgi:hypothetical protein